MISISCDNICLSYGADSILEDITFSLQEGDKLGIIGVNGAGKSSLFSLITGKIKATGGAVYISKDKTVGLLEQNISYKSDKTILDEAYSTFSDLLKLEKTVEELREKAEKSGLEEDAARFTSAHERFTKEGGYEFRGRCKGILKNLGMTEAFWDKPVTALSGGQKTRLSLACLLLRDPDILMLDEPTNHLDMDALFWLEGYLKSSKKTVLVISHDRYFLDSTVGKILEIENRKSRLFSGNYSEYVHQKVIDREIQQRHYDNQQKEIKRIEAYIEQQRRWNRERNIIAAESRQKALDRMKKVERPDALPDSVRMTFEKSGESGNDVMTVTGLSKSYPGKELFSDVSFVLKKHDRMFFCGENGCGKSTLIKILAGRIKADKGYAVPGYNVKIGYYDQENQDLNMSNTVLEEIWGRYPAMTETAVRNTLALFLFKGEDVEKKVSVLSGGEKARLTLTKLMLSKMNLLILDEPTNHLDIPSREALENAILDFDGTVIAVSHDRYFINKLATRIADFGAEQERKLFLFDGGYGEYLEYKKDYLTKDSVSVNDSVVTASKEQYLESKRNLSEQRKNKKRLEKAKSDAESTEGRLSEIENEMNGEAAFDHVRLTELTKEKEECEERLLECYEIIDELEGI